jgi:hypothetical protein
MVCHYVMLTAKPYSQKRRTITVSNSAAAHCERKRCRQKRSVRVTTIRLAVWMEEIPTYKSSDGRPQLPYSDLLECRVVVIAQLCACR